MKSNVTNPEIPDGIIIVDKPSGWTSHDVVRKVKNLLGGVKTGHAGTLDPAATGVLVLLIGKATRESSWITGEDKRYLAVVTFGYSTDTYDADGKTTDSGDPLKIDLELLQKSVLGLEGEWEQLPPLFSAVKVKGKRLYQYARSGSEPERLPRTIKIKRITADYSNFPDIVLDVTCSKGTYIRELANRLGVMTGCPAHLSSLRRIASGSFFIENAVSLETLQESIGRGEPFTFIRPIPGRHYE